MKVLKMHRAGPVSRGEKTPESQHNGKNRKGGAAEHRRADQRDGAGFQNTPDLEKNRAGLTRSEMLEHLLADHRVEESIREGPLPEKISTNQRLVVAPGKAEPPR